MFPYPKKVVFDILNSFRMWLSDIRKAFRICYDTKPIPKYTSHSLSFSCLSSYRFLFSSLVCIPQKHINNLELIQRRATRFILGQSSGDQSYRKHLQQLNFIQFCIYLLIISWSPALDFIVFHSSLHKKSLNYHTGHIIFIISLIVLIHVD